MKKRIFEISSSWKNTPVKDYYDQGAWSGKIVVNENNVAIGIAKDAKHPNTPYILFGSYIQDIGFSIGKFNVLSDDRDLVFFAGFRNNPEQPNTYHGTVEQSFMGQVFDDFLKCNKLDSVEIRNLGNAVSLSTELPYNADMATNITETYNKYASFIRDNKYYTGIILNRLEKQDNSEVCKRIMDIYSETNGKAMSALQYVASKHKPTTEPEENTFVL